MHIESKIGGRVSFFFSRCEKLLGKDTGSEILLLIKDLSNIFKGSCSRPHLTKLSPDPLVAFPNILGHIHFKHPGHFMKSVVIYTGLSIAY